MYFTTSGLLMIAWFVRWFSFCHAAWKVHICSSVWTTGHHFNQKIQLCIENGYTRGTFADL